MVYGSLRLGGAFLLVPAIVLLHPVPGSCGILTVKLQDHTLASWDQYVDRFERSEYEARPLLDATSDRPVLVNLNPAGKNGGEDVPGGYIHHWIGAIRIMDTQLASVVRVLEDYSRYPQIYSPEVKAASASRNPAATGWRYDARLLTEQVEKLGLHFAFDMRCHVSAREAGGFTLIESRTYRIRESASGRPPYTDLLPEGRDHGIVWRLNVYWRLRQMGPAVYAECQAISLSRKPLIGMRDLIQSRARESLSSTLRHTRDAARQ